MHCGSHLLYWPTGTSASLTDLVRVNAYDLRGRRSPQRGERTDYGKAEEASESNTAEKVGDSERQEAQGIQVRTSKTKKADDCPSQAQTHGSEESCAEKIKADETGDSCSRNRRCRRDRGTGSGA